MGSFMNEEFRLILAEEKRIGEVLAIARNILLSIERYQVNCFEIERLHLESMKAKILKNLAEQEQSVGQVLEVESEAETSTVNLMQNATAKSTEKNEAVDIALNDVTVNDQELNLAVSNDAFNMNPTNEDEEDEGDRFDDMIEDSDDDMFIDINMLMNGEGASGGR